MKACVDRRSPCRERRALALAGFASLLLPLAGCISVGIGNDAGVQPFHVLHDPGATVQPLATPRVATLLIQALPADAVAETVSIAYSRRPHERAFYKLASWNERPVRRIPQLLRQRLQARTVAGAVGLIGEPLQSPWLLTVGIDELVHDVASPPGSARVSLSLALYDRSNGRRLAGRTFAASAATPTSDSAHAVAAMSLALGQVFDEIVPWVESVLPSAARP